MMRFVLILCWLALVCADTHTHPRPVPTERSYHCNGKWTKFFNFDSPRNGIECELFATIRERCPHDVCRHPTGVDARVRRTNEDYSTTGNIVAIGATYGISCKNNDQSHRRCKDYKVRFCCPKKPSNKPIVRFCRGHWTAFYNIDSPQDGMEAELLNQIQQDNPAVCAHPTDFDARLAKNNMDYTTSNDVLQVGPTYGLSCIKQHQKDKKCENYKIRFCCPEEPKEKYCYGKWTEYFNRDNTDDGNEDETLEQILMENPDQVCQHPNAFDALSMDDNKDYSLSEDVVKVGAGYGLSCKKTDQKDYRPCKGYKIRFCCPLDQKPYCKGHWTESFNHHDPTVEANDTEELSTIMNKYPDHVCSSPVAIDATFSHKMDYKTGNDKVKVGQFFGLTCQNDEQKDHQCEDYSVKFCCKEDYTNPDCPKGYWTDFFNIDTPDDGEDTETLAAIRVNNTDVCETPTDIDARLATDHMCYTTSGDKVKVGPKFGIVCKNEDQVNTTCQDYQVRFFCSNGFDGDE